MLVLLEHTALSCHRIAYVYVVFSFSLVYNLSGLREASFILECFSLRVRTLIPSAQWPSDRVRYSVRPGDEPRQTLTPHKHDAPVAWCTHTHGQTHVHTRPDTLTHANTLIPSTVHLRCLPCVLVYVCVVLILFVCSPIFFITLSLSLSHTLVWCRALIKVTHYDVAACQACTTLKKCQ